MKEEIGICLLCGKFSHLHEGVCSICRVELFKELFCSYEMQQRPSSPTPSTICMSVYGNFMKFLIERYKKTAVKKLCPFVSSLYAVHLDTLLSIYTTIGVIPIPCSYHALRMRGWDHMELIGQYLAYQNPHIRCICLLNRNHAIEHKRSLRNKHGEKEGVEPYILANQQEIHSDIQALVVIDDIVTSGSSVTMCTNLIKTRAHLPIYALCAAMD